MNRHLKVSLTLTALSLTTIGLLTSCNSSTDLEGKINSNHAELQTALSNAIKKAESELANAKTELQGLITAGDVSSVQQLTDAIKNLNASIEAAKKYADNQDTALSAELEAAIESAKMEAVEASTAILQAAKTEFNDAFAAGDLAVTTRLDVEVKSLQDAIKTVELLASEGDVALQAELKAAIEAVKAEANALITDRINAETLAIQKLVDEGMTTMDSQFANHVNALTLSIEAGKVFAAESDEAMRNELILAINASRQEATDAIAMSVALMSEELTEAIEAGDKASVAEVQASLDEIRAAIDAANKLAAENDALLKDELGILIAITKSDLQEEMATAVSAASAELKELLAKHEATSAEELKTFYDTFKAMIVSAEKLAVDGDAAVKAELEAAIDAAKAEMTAELTKFSEDLLALFNEKLDNADFATRAEVGELSNAIAEALAEAKDYAYSSDEALKSGILNDVYDLFAESSAAYEAAMENLASEIRAEMDAGFLKSAEDLTNATNELKSLIDAMSKTAEAGDASVRAELNKAIEDAKVDVANVVTLAMDSALAELETKINDGDAKAKEELTNAIVTLQELIAVAEETAKTDNALLKTELEAKIETVRTDVSAMVDEIVNQAVADLEAKLNAQKVDTDAAIKASFDELKALIDALEAGTAAADEATREAFQEAIHNAYDSVLETVDGKLAALKAELEEAIKNADTSVGNKADELTAMIEATQTAFADADVALKDELTTLINNTKNELLDSFTKQLEADKAELLQKIEEGDKANADALVQSKVELEKKISDIKTMCEALKKQDGEFHLKFDALQNEIKASIAAVSDASMKLADWGVATDNLVEVEGGLDRLEAVFESYKSKVNTYINDDFAKVEELYADYWVRMIRATSIDEIDVLVSKFNDEAATVRTWPDVIYDALMDVGASVDEVEYDADGEGLRLVESLLAQAASLGNADVDSGIAAYGPDAINLTDLYNEYMDQYIALLKQSGGQGIKDRMDAVVGQPIIWTDSVEPDSLKMVLSSIRTEYDGWISDPANSLDNVEGFAESLAAFEAVEARFAALNTAKAEADAINADVLVFIEEVNKNGATWTNDYNVNGIKSRIHVWVETYFSGDYANEVTDATANYLLVNHAKAQELYDLFDNKVAEFKEEAQKFADKVDAVGEINLLSWDEINAALSQYGELVLSRDLNDFEYLFNDENAPSDYYNKLVTIYAEYRVLKTNAYNDYTAAANALDGVVVSIYDGAVVNALVSWYDTYGVKDASGALVFDNGDAGVGYVLSNSLTVMPYDYEAAMKLSAQYEALVTAKNVETAAIIEMIESIGYVTTHDATLISNVTALYEAWLSGANVTNVENILGLETGLVDAQFAIVAGRSEYEVTNLQTLLDAQTRLEELFADADDIHTAIAKLEPRRSYPEFKDAADRVNYLNEIQTIEAMLNTFSLNNNDDVHDPLAPFTADELNKVATGRLACVRHEYASYFMTIHSEFSAIVDTYAISDLDKDAAKTSLTKLYNMTLKGIDQAVDAEAVKELATLAEYKINAMKGAMETYVKYVAALEADTTLEDAERDNLSVRLSVSIETTVLRMVESGNTDDVDLNVKFVVDELESIYPLG